jgi:hypothetical protein
VRCTPDDLHALIAIGRVNVDLHAAGVAEPQQVQLFPAQETASTYALVGTNALRGTIPF